MPNFKKKWRIDPNRKDIPFDTYPTSKTIDLHNETLNFWNSQLDSFNLTFKNKGNSGEEFSIQSFKTQTYLHYSKIPIDYLKENDDLLGKSLKDFKIKIQKSINLDYQDKIPKISNYPVLHKDNTNPKYTNLNNLKKIYGAFVPHSKDLNLVDKMHKCTVTVDGVEKEKDVYMRYDIYKLKKYPKLNISLNSEIIVYRIVIESIVIIKMMKEKT